MTSGSNYDGILRATVRAARYNGPGFDELRMGQPLGTFGTTRISPLQRVRALDLHIDTFDAPLLPTTLVSDSPSVANFFVGSYSERNVNAQKMGMKVISKSAIRKR